MSITVERFMETVSDYKVSLVAGKDGATNVIDWFNIVENTFALEQLNEKELVLSSGKGLENEDNFVLFAEALIAKKSSDLVLFSNRYVPQLPERIIKLCNEKAFPVMQVHHEVNVSNITKLISIQLLESEKINRQLFSAMKNAISFPEKTEGYIPLLMQYGFKKNEPYAVSIIKLNQLESMSTSEAQWVVKALEAQLLSAGDKSFVLTMDDIFVFVFSNYSEEEIRAIMLKIIVLLRMKDYTFYEGSSVNHSGVTKLSNAYMQAKKVIDLSQRKAWKNMIVDYRELGAYQLLLSIDDKEVMKRYFDDVLGKLEKMDSDNGSDYMEFLKVYLTCNCNINDTADKLFIHRNTVVYKIKKINELLDCDLSEIEVRVRLYLAIMMYNII